MAQGRSVSEPPAPDPEQMATDAMITSVVAGICFVVATIIFGVVGGLGISLGQALGGRQTLTMVLVAVAFLGTIGLIGWQLISNADRIRARNRNWYRGAWIGTILSFVIISMMYYAPWIVIPQYCPPGAPCGP